MFTVNRSEANPLISPNAMKPWEAAATFNWCPVKNGKKIDVVYRAVSETDPLDGTHRQNSIIARAESSDGEHFTDRLPFITPTADFDRFGCEDPRVTKLGGTYYTFYTALSTFPFSAEGIKVGVALSKDMKTITEKHPVTPFNAKAMALFPEKVGGKLAAILTVHPDQPPSDIAYVEFDKPEDMWSEAVWKEWYANLSIHAIGLRRDPADQVEVGAPPIKTKKGWLVVYSHISHYSSGGTPVFGIEAVLLDLKNPRKVIGRTKGPMITSETYYEVTGFVPNVVFPSGALVQGETLEIYYGAADTHCAKATVNLDHLLAAMLPKTPKPVVRYSGNPIIAPREGKAWEEGGTLNPAAIDLGGKVHLLYRAATATNVSTVGYAASKDGFTVDERLEDPIFKARTDFEGVGRSEGAGCEDARIVEIGGLLYMTYTAFDGVTPRVAVSTISKEDFLAKRWDAWSAPQVLSDPGIPNKDAFLLPEAVNGEYYIFHRVGTAVCADILPSLDFSKNKIKRCIEVIGPRRGMWDTKKVGLAGPPIKTKEGWLALYHGISEHGTYRVGAILLDLERPTVVLARTAAPILEPEEDYERKGVVNNVVFPCGAVCRKGTLYIYYGAADKVTCVATAKLPLLLDILTS